MWQPHKIKIDCSSKKDTSIENVLLAINILLHSLNSYQRRNKSHHVFSVSGIPPQMLVGKSHVTDLLPHYNLQLTIFSVILVTWNIQVNILALIFNDVSPWQRMLPSTDRHSSKRSPFQNTARELSIIHNSLCYEQLAGTSFLNCLLHCMSLLYDATLTSRNIN